jgi:flagellum-specific peptidoglycan hydrolase FlgJ
MCCTLFFATNVSTSQAQNALTKNYIAQYAELATSLSKEFQIPTSVILAIAIVESGSGTSKLAKKFHNHFGIKGSNTHSMQLLGYKSSYKEYDSDSASYRHFCEKIANKNLYPITKGNPNCSVWFKRIAKSGYAASASAWYNKMMYVVKTYDLTQYDVAFDTTPPSIVQPTDSLPPIQIVPDSVR